MEVGSLGVNGAHVLRRVALGHSTAPGAVPGLARHMVVKSVLGLLDRPGDVILITALVMDWEKSITAFYLVTCYRKLVETSW